MYLFIYLTQIVLAMFPNSILTSLLFSCFLVPDIHSPWILSAEYLHKQCSIFHPTLMSSLNLTMSVNVPASFFCAVAFNILMFTLYSTPKKSTCLRGSGSMCSNDALIVIRPSLHQRVDGASLFVWFGSLVRPDPWQILYVEFVYLKKYENGEIDCSVDMTTNQRKLRAEL